MYPTETLRTAAARMRERVEALPEDEWGQRPWDVDQCAGTGASGCPCIVYHGENKPFDEPQVPPIMYVADAEGPEFAFYIASMHPAFGLAVADLLEKMARAVDKGELDSRLSVVANQALVVANAYLEVAT